MTRSETTELSDVLGNEQCQHAVPASSSLEELLADRIATEAARLAEERIRAMFAVTEFDPDEVYGPMTSETAADFLRLPYSSFREIAPSLPRRHATAVRVPEAGAPDVAVGAIRGLPLGGRNVRLYN